MASGWQVRVAKDKERLFPAALVDIQIYRQLIKDLKAGQRRFIGLSTMNWNAVEVYQNGELVLWRKSYTHRWKLPQDMVGNFRPLKEPKPFTGDLPPPDEEFLG